MPRVELQGGRGVPPVRGRAHPKFVNARGAKEQRESEGPQSTRVLLVRYMVSVEMLAPDLLCKHTAVGFG